MARLMILSVVVLFGCQAQTPREKPTSKAQDVAPKAAPKPAATTHKSLQTGDRPAQDRRTNANAQCKDDGATRWLDGNPHTPLAIVHPKGIAKPDNACCLSWSKSKAIWTQIDRFGHAVSLHHLVKYEAYDVTQCYEPQLKLHRQLDQKKKGVGLLFSGKTPHHKPGKPVALGVEDLKQINPILKNLYKAFKAPLTTAKPIGFKVGDGEDSSYTQCAVAGGALLVIVCKGKRVDWKLTYIDHSIWTSYDFATSANHFNVPRAILDLNGDGQVEVIVQQNEGASWWDTIIQFQVDDATPWRALHSSVGGATI